MTDPEGHEVSFLVTGTAQLCGRTVALTTIKTIFLLEIARNNKRLFVQPQTAQDVDLILEEATREASLASNTALIMSNYAGRMADQSCIQSNANLKNTQLMLLIAPAAALLDFFHGASCRRAGTALAVTEGNPLRARLYNFHPPSTNYNLCCQNIPVIVTTSSGKQISMFAYQISRVLTPHCHPVPCGPGHEIMTTLPGERAVTATMVDGKSKQWDFMNKLSDQATKQEDRELNVCDDGKTFDICKYPQELMPTKSSEPVQSVGWDSLKSSMMFSLWNSTNEEADSFMSRAMADRAALNNDISSLATGHGGAADVIPRIAQQGNQNQPDGAGAGLATTLLGADTTKLLWVYIPRILLAALFSSRWDLSCPLQTLCGASSLT